MTIRSSFTRSEGISYLHYILFFPWTQADVKQDFNAALFHTTQVRNKGLSSSKNYTQNHKIIIKVINMTRAVFKSSEAIQKLCVKKKTKFKLLFNYTMCICVFKFVLLFKYNIQIQLKLGALKFKKKYIKSTFIIDIQLCSLIMLFCSNLVSRLILWYTRINGIWNHWRQTWCETSWRAIFK